MVETQKKIFFCLEKKERARIKKEKKKENNKGRMNTSLEEDKYQLRSAKASLAVFRLINDRESLAVAEYERIVFDLEERIKLKEEKEKQVWNHLKIYLWMEMVAIQLSLWKSVLV